LGQLLRAVPNIKCYIFNLIPSKLTLPKPIITSIAIYHQMVVIQIQVGKNFIEDVLLNGGLELILLQRK
jgi:hypothetical protein